MSTKTNAVATVKEKEITAQVLNKINTFQSAGQLKLPADYSPENALKAAYLILLETENKDRKKALEFCSKESIANALLKMVVWGLSPLKKQCDFIMYGNKLECSLEYAGNIALAKRYGGLTFIKANAIFEGDEFEFTVDPMTGTKKIIKHNQTLDSIGNKKIKGAYAIYTANDVTDCEIMNMNQIIDAWNQGAMKGNSPAHKNFPDQMSIKTVINRACKLLIRSSDDSILMDDSVKDVDQIDVVAEDVSHEIEQNANTQDLEEAQVIQEELKPNQGFTEEEINQQLFDEAIEQEQRQTDTIPFD